MKNKRKQLNYNLNKNVNIMNIYKTHYIIVRFKA